MKGLRLTSLPLITEIAGAPLGALPHSPYRLHPRTPDEVTAELRQRLARMKEPA